MPCRSTGRANVEACQVAREGEAHQTATHVDATLVAPGDLTLTEQREVWRVEAALTPLGQLPFFIDFLKVAGLCDAFIADCPLRYTSPNVPKKRDVLGTTMLSMLSGHKRYAHIAGLRCDSVLPELLGMNKIISEDAVSDRLITRPFSHLR